MAHGLTTAGGAIRGTRFMEYLAGMLLHSGLMFAERITLAHFSVSSAMNLPKSAGVIDFGTLPMPANCVINLGSARAASIASWSLSMIAAGVSFGATTPFHTLAS